MDLGGFGNTASTGGVNIAADGYITSILHVSVGQFTSVLEKVADMRAENGAEQNRVINSLELLQTNMTNLEAAYGRIMDTDVVIESTRFARHNVLVQASGHDSSSQPINKRSLTALGNHIEIFSSPLIAIWRGGDE